MLNKPTSSGTGEVGDAINTPYKPESCLGVTDVKVKVHEERKQEVSPNTKDAKEAECCCSITEHSNHVNPEIRDSTRARYPVVLERSKQLELATFCVSDSGSKACHDPGLELATAGIDLLASVAISESSSNHETESTVILSRSLPALETDMVSEKGELKSFDDAKTDRKGEAIDSLPEASAESSLAARNQELDGSQYILSSSNEIEIKNGCESDEKGKIQEPSSGIQSEERTAKLEAAISESKAVLAAQKRSLSQANDSVTSIAVPFIDKSSNKNLVLPEFETGTLMVGTYSIDDGGITDQEEKDERVADVGQAIQRKEETDMREFNASRKFGRKDVIEVFMQVAKDGKQSEKNGIISSKEKSNHEGTMTKEINQADSFFEHPFKAFDQLESYESLGNNVNHSPSTSMLAQRYTGCTSLNDELDRKVMGHIDTNKADQILVISEKLAIEIPDNDRNWSLHQQQASSVELTSQQITEPVAPHSEPKINDQNATDQNLEIEIVTKDDHPPKCEKLDFDLNEEFGEEAFLQDNVSLHALPSSKLMLVTATRGPFIHPESSIQSKGEPGWRGSAATSAFRLANARHVVQKIHSVSEGLMPDAISSQNLKPSTQPLNFDLNVTEEQVLEEDDRSAEVSLAMNMHDRILSCSTGLKDINVFCNITTIDKQIKWPVLDLNIIHEPEDGGEAGEHRVDSNKVALQTCMNSKLAFDLNGGPVIEIIDEPTPPAQNVRSIANADASASGAKIAGNKRNVCQWSEQAKNIYCAKAEYISPPIRAAGPESVYHTVTADPSANQFHGDAYKSGTAFPSSTISYNQNPYLHGGYTFGFNNSSFSSVSAQHMESSRSSPFMAATSPVPSSVSVMPSYARTSAVGVRETTRSTNEGTWTRKSLDLNAGPDAHEMTEAREDRMNGRLLYTGLTKRPYQQVIEVLEGPVEGERLKKMKEVEATAWGMQQRECLLFKQQTWR